MREGGVAVPRVLSCVFIRGTGGGGTEGQEVVYIDARKNKSNVRIREIL